MGFLGRLAAKKAPPLVADPPSASYRVQVLLPRPAVLDPRAIHAYLTSWRDDVALVGNDPARFAVAIPTGTAMPIVVHVFQAPVHAYAKDLDDSLRWSQTWRERREVVARARESIVVATAMQPGPLYAAQLLSLLAVLDTVLVTLDERDAAAAVLHWVPAQQVMPSIRYRLLRKELGPSGPSVNVRISGVGGRPGEMLADTIGFAPLGLPDLQVRFCNRDPNEVALRMMLLAREQFMGSPPEGAVEDTSLASPERAALTIELD